MADEAEARRQWLLTMVGALLFAVGSLMLVCQSIRPHDRLLFPIGLGCVMSATVLFRRGRARLRTAIEQLFLARGLDELAAREQAADYVERRLLVDPPPFSRKRPQPERRIAEQRMWPRTFSPH